MNILQLIQTIRNITAAIQAKDYGTVFKLVMEILNTFAAQSDPAIKMMAAEPATPEQHAELKAAISELECCCNEASKA